MRNSAAMHCRSCYASLLPRLLLLMGNITEIVVIVIRRATTHLFGGRKSCSHSRDDWSKTRMMERDEKGGIGRKHENHSTVVFSFLSFDSIRPTYRVKFSIKGQRCSSARRSRYERCDHTSSIAYPRRPSPPMAYSCPSTPSPSAPHCQGWTPSCCDSRGRNAY